jgi:hypothetical protein
VVSIFKLSIIYAHVKALKAAFLKESCHQLSYISKEIFFDKTKDNFIALEKVFGFIASIFLGYA